MKPSYPESVAEFESLLQSCLPQTLAPKSRYRYMAILRELFDYLVKRKEMFRYVTVQAWLDSKVAFGWDYETVSQALRPIRHCARMAFKLSMISLKNAATIIKRIRNNAKRKVPIGKVFKRLLTRKEVGTILRRFDMRKVAEQRDFLIIGLIVGAGLYRKEVSSIRVDQVRSMAGGWAIVALEGSRGRYRDVPLPSWLAAAINAHKEAARLKDGHLVRPVRRGKLRYTGKPMHPLSIEQVVLEKAAIGGQNVRARDLRYTWASLSLKAGASLEQVMQNLGLRHEPTLRMRLGLPKKRKKCKRRPRPPKPLREDRNSIFATRRKTSH